MTYQVAFHCVLFFTFIFLEPWWILAFECIRSAIVIYSALIKPVIRSSFVRQLRSAAWSWEESVCELETFIIYLQSS